MRAHEFLTEDAVDEGKLARTLAGAAAVLGLSLGGKALYDKFKHEPQQATLTQPAQPEKEIHDVESNLRQVATQYKIKGEELWHLMSQASHESMGFTRFRENLNYDSPRRLVNVYPSYFKNTKQAKPYVNNPEKLANLVYANRFGNGDEASGDGWRYRGRGPLMITFKENYKDVQKVTGIPLESNPDLAADPKFSSRVAVAFWMIKVRRKVSDFTNLRAVTKVINPGMQDIKRRHDTYQKYKEQDTENDKVPESISVKQSRAGQEGPNFKPKKRTKPLITSPIKPTDNVNNGRLVGDS